MGLELEVAVALRLQAATAWEPTSIQRYTLPGGANQVFYFGRPVISDLKGGGGMFCANCGGGVNGEASFCGECGAELTRRPVLLPTRRSYEAASPMASTSREPSLVFAPNVSVDHVPESTHSNSAGVAAWILLVFACAGALIPGFGFAMWLIIGPILLITLVLGVMAISNGRTASGVLIILMSLIVVPLFVIAAPFLGTAIAVRTATTSVNEQSKAPSLSNVESSVPAGGVLSMPVPVITSPEVPAEMAEPTDVEDEEAAIRTTSPRDLLPPVDDGASALPSAEVPSVRISTSVGYAVLRTQPTVFSKGLGRLTPGTLVTLGESVPNGDWVEASTVDGRRGYLNRNELDER